MDQERIQMVSQYLRLLAEMEAWGTSHVSAGSRWLHAYSEALEGRSLPILMALLHPRHFNDRSGVDFSDQLLPAHRRVPSSDVWGTCESGTLVEGLECGRHAETQDHFWPFSLGGISRGDNYVRLCQVCNAMKAHSVILWSWRWPPPEWVLDRLAQISRFKQ